MSWWQGEKIAVEIFGESHGPAIGAVLEGLPAGEPVNMAEAAAFMARRSPGQNRCSSARREKDEVEVLSGLHNGRTCGTPLAVLIRNKDVRREDYEACRHLPRPGHADWPAELRYRGNHDRSGGGHFSGRLTAPLCFAGAVAKQLLARRGITIGAHLAAVAGIADNAFNPVDLTAETLTAPGGREFPVLNAAAGEQMLAAIAAAAANGDSVGAVIEGGALGYPGGIGGPLFAGLEGRLSQAFFAIPAVRAVEFGAGFAAAAMRGSTHNDHYLMKNGKIVTATNNHGGILGGISTGMPIIFRAAIKPTPSIALPQHTVNTVTGEPAELQIRGRHDPCIGPRAVPAVEAAAALVLLDALTAAE